MTKLTIVGVDGVVLDERTLTDEHLPLPMDLVVLDDGTTCVVEQRRFQYTDTPTNYVVLHVRAFHAG